MLLIDRYDFRVAPEPLELIKFPERRVKDVDDHIHIVEKDPASLLDSFDVMSARALPA